MQKKQNPSISGHAHAGNPKELSSGTKETRKLKGLDADSALKRRVNEKLIYSTFSFLKLLPHGMKQKDGREQGRQKDMSTGPKQEIPAPMSSGGAGVSAQQLSVPVAANQSPNN